MPREDHVEISQLACVKTMQRNIAVIKAKSVNMDFMTVSQWMNT